MNTLVFYTNKKLTQRSDHPNSIGETGEYPCFVLVFNYDWDDYGYKTWFCLYYMPSATEKIQLGEMKLMKAGEQNTFETLPRRFEGALDDTYCSLGKSTSYYKNIRSRIEDLDLRNRLLESLRDCVHDSHIRENFLYDDVFCTSLMADQSSVEALRIGEFILIDTDYRSAFKFESTLKSRRAINLKLLLAICDKNYAFYYRLFTFLESKISLSPLLTDCN